MLDFYGEPDAFDWKPDYSADVAEVLKSGAFDRVKIHSIPYYETPDVGLIADGIKHARTPEIILEKNYFGLTEGAGKAFGDALALTDARSVSLAYNDFMEKEIPFLADGLAQTKAERVDLSWYFEDAHNVYAPFGRALAQNKNDTVLVDQNDIYPANPAKMLQLRDSRLRDAFFETKASQILTQPILGQFVERAGSLSAQNKTGVYHTLVENGVFKDNPDLIQSLRAGLYSYDKKMTK